MADPPSPRCRLLELPAELRIQIYREVLVQSTPVIISFLKGGFERSNLVRTCRQIYFEGLYIFYSENTFRNGRVDDVLERCKKGLIGVGGERWEKVVGGEVKVDRSVRGVKKCGMKRGEFPEAGVN